MNRYLIVL